MSLVERTSRVGLKTARQYMGSFVDQKLIEAFMKTANQYDLPQKAFKRFRNLSRKYPGLNWERLAPRLLGITQDGTPGQGSVQYLDELIGSGEFHKVFPGQQSNYLLWLSKNANVYDGPMQDREIRWREDIQSDRCDRDDERRRAVSATQAQREVYRIAPGAPFHVYDL